MSIEVVRITNNPVHKVVIGLLPPQTIERVTLKNEALEALSPAAQEHVARLLANGGSPLVFQWYEPRPCRVSSAGDPAVFATRAYVSSELPARLASPVPFTVDLVVEWIENLTFEATSREQEAADWYATMNRAEYCHLQSTDEGACYAGLQALTENGRNYVNGPYGVTWGLSSDGMARMIRIEADRRIESDKRNATAKEQRKARRAEFVLAIVEMLGSENQKERFAEDLLPMCEVEIMLHEHVLNSCYSRLCEDEDLEVTQEAARLPAGAFEVLKMFRARVDMADLSLVGSVKCTPVVGYERPEEFEGRGNRRLLVEVQISDDPKHSDWSSTALYYLD